MEARPTLSPTDQQLFRRAQVAYNQQRFGEVADMLRPLLARGVIHADVFALHARACGRSDQLAEARQAINAAVNLDRQNVDFWTLLADIADMANDDTGHIVARQQLTHLAPQNAAHWASLGYALLRVGDDEQAQAALERAIELDPQHARARHNLALLLRNMDEAVAALAVLEPSIAGADANSLALRAHLVADLGRYDEAVAVYRDILSQTPTHVDTHETLSALLPQLGRADEAMGAYAAALAVAPQDRALWVSALTRARAVDDVARLDQWSAQALGRFAGDPDFVTLRADALGMGGDAWAAARLLEEACAAHPEHDAAHLAAAYWNLVRQEPAAAEPYAVRATHLAPQDQTAWAYLSTIWRLRADPRSAWLSDIDVLTCALEINPPSGCASLSEFTDQFQRYLTDLHQTVEHPAEQSLRQGTQTRGHLFQKRDPIMTAFVLEIRAQCEAWLRSLPRDETHPFLGRNTGSVGFLNSWSVRLRDSGFHINHIHHKGWLSSAFYVAVPPEVLAPAEDDDGPAPGSLGFGLADSAMGYDAAPLATVRPQPGKLCLFPSYFWHGTVPFHSAAPDRSI